MGASLRRRVAVPLAVTVLILGFLVAGVPAAPGALPEGTPSPPTVATGAAFPVAPRPGSLSVPAPAAGMILHLGSVLKDLALDPARGRVYVADWTDNEVLAVALGNGSIVARVPVRAEPSSLAIDPADQNLYVAQAGNMSIAVVNLTSLTVSRFIPLSFLPWQLVAPDNVTLLITSNMDQWTMQYAVVLNVTSGAVESTLGSGWYQDPIIALSPDRQWAYMADQLIPVTMAAYHRYGNGVWVWVAATSSSTWGLFGGFGRDIVSTPDDRFVYLAANTSAAPVYSCLNQFDATNLTFIRAIGTYPYCSTVVLSPTSGRIASAGSGHVIHVSLPDGTWVNDLPTTEAVDRLRLLPDASAFVAILGTNATDLGIFPTTAVSSGSPAPGTYWNHSPPVTARVESLEAWSTLSGALSLDGVPLTGAQYNASSGWLTAPPPGPLPSGAHTVVAAALRGGVAVASTSWSFTVDVTPPVLSVVPPPAAVGVPYVWVNGTASDPSGVTVWVARRVVLAAVSGSFSANVSLLQGSNAIEVRASDAASNAAWSNVTVRFSPSLRWAVDLWDRFRIAIPYGWTNRTNATNVYGQAYAALLTNYTATIGVRADNLSGPAPPAYRLLLDEIANLSVNGQFTLLSPVANTTIDGLDAATAVVSYLPIAYYAQKQAEVVGVIVGPAWGRAWTVEAMLQARWLPVLGSILNDTIASFQAWPASVTPPPPSPSPGSAPAGMDWWPWAVAVVAAAAVFAVVVLSYRWRKTRRMRPPPPPSTPPSA